MRVGRAAATFAFLGIAWVLWSGHFTPLLLTLGAGSCALSLWLAQRMQILDDEGEPLQIAAGLLAYIPWLFWQIARANWQVARLIWTPSLPIRPQMLRVPASQRSELGNAIYANSITLTPGTVALDVRDGGILVHALTDSSREELQSGEMDRRVSRIESGGGAGAG